VSLEDIKIDQEVRVMERRVPAVLLVLQASVVVVVILLAAYVVARAQSPRPSAQAEATKNETARADAATADAAKPAAPAPAFDQARFDRLRTEGFDALMNLDYEGATARFREMAQAFPDHPGGSQFLAAALWLKTLNNSRRLQSDIYNSDSFYEGEEDKVDPKLITEFKDLTRQAGLLAQIRLKKNPDDVEAMYFLGATEGLKSAFEAAVERRFFGALRDSKDSVDLHHKVLKLDPNYHDAEISIGMYDYIVGGLPWFARQMVRAYASGGSKKRGIEALERVVREGRWAKDDARVLLIPIYKRERRFEDAATITRELAARYPRNYIFKLELADALVSQAETLRAADPAAASKIEQEAFATFESLINDRPARGTATRQLDQVHFQYAEALFNAGQTERAAREFVAAASVANAEASLATMAHLRAAQSLDLAGRRADALAQYKAVLARPDVFKAHEAAERGLKEPYRKPQSATTGGAGDGAGEQEATGAATKN
jgi:tetratricopeptide (TPR) repeat protein